MELFLYIWLKEWTHIYNSYCLVREFLLRIRFNPNWSRFYCFTVPGSSCDCNSPEPSCTLCDHWRGRIHTERLANQLLGWEYALWPTDLPRKWVQSYLGLILLKGDIWFQVAGCSFVKHPIMVRMLMSYTWLSCSLLTDWIAFSPVGSKQNCLIKSTSAELPRLWASFSESFLLLHQERQLSG